jgi:hypothetical protein
MTNPIPWWRPAKRRQKLLDDLNDAFRDLNKSAEAFDQRVLTVTQSLVTVCELLLAREEANRTKQDRGPE